MWYFRTMRSTWISCCGPPERAFTHPPNPVHSLGVVKGRQHAAVLKSKTAARICDSNLRKAFSTLILVPTRGVELRTY